jgi:DNA polymerase III delta subunit
MAKVTAAEFRHSNHDPQGQWCLLLGPEHELKLRARSAIINRLVAPEDRGYAVETMTLAKGARAAAVIRAAQTPAMLGATRVVVVESIENLSAGEQRELARGLQAAPSTTVILVEGARGQHGDDRPRGGDRAGRLSRELMEAVADAGSVVECHTPTRDDAAAWVAAEAHALGAAIKPATAAMLVERVGADLGRLSREVEKLSLLAVGDEGITTQHIEEATAPTPEDNIFAVGDAIGVGDGDRALAALRDLMLYQGVEPTTALAFIARQLRLIWQARVLLDAGWRGGAEVPAAAQALLPERNDIRQYLGGRRWLVNRLLGQARRFPWPRLIHAVRRVLTAELSLKGVGAGISDPRIALEMLALDLCRWDGRSATGEG